MPALQPVAGSAARAVKHTGGAHRLETQLRSVPTFKQQDWERTCALACETASTQVPAEAASVSACVRVSVTGACMKGHVSVTVCMYVGVDMHV